MVWMTGRATLARDITSAIAFIGGYEYGKRTANAPFRSEDLVLVGHSAGGGLCQYFMSKGLGDVGALVLIAAIPAFGGLVSHLNKVTPVLKNIASVYIKIGLNWILGFLPGSIFVIYGIQDHLYPRQLLFTEPFSHRPFHAAKS